jgi:Cys-Gly metallodipeptidase DUG1
LTKLGAQDIQLRELGTQPPPVANPNLQLPPVILSRFGSDPSKKTILIYGHYDVQPALKEDGWNTDPFKLVEKNDVLYGRGSSDDKGPVVAWLNSIEAHNELGLELPVNLITVFEGMEESGSLGLDELIAKEATGYFKGVDAVTISDNYWLGTTKPVLTYGLRGVNYYEISVSGPQADLHSGLFGGIVAEPLNDLVKILAGLVDTKGKILIKGVDEQVAVLTEEEDKLYDDIEFDVSVLNQATGSNTALYNDKKSILQHRWRYPSLSIHGIEGAFYEAGAKTVIPAKVKGKFSIRTVPDISSEKLTELVAEHVLKASEDLDTPNKVEVNLIHDGDYWLSDPFNENFTAARLATKEVWGVEPDLTREGGSIPITLTFENELKTSVLLLPLGRGDDGAHSTNEKIDVSNYIEGVKTLTAYLHYYAQGAK